MHNSELVIKEAARLKKAIANELGEPDNDAEFERQLSEGVTDAKDDKEAKEDLGSGDS
jgi:hypothetical protein